MDRTATSPGIGPDAVFMVEVYRPAGAAIDQPGAILGPGDPPVLAVIEVPGDEIALIVIDAPDAATAERAARARGLRPIRVVPVQWDTASDGRLDP